MDNIPTVNWLRFFLICNMVTITAAFALGYWIGAA